MPRLRNFVVVAPCPHPACSACTYAYRDGEQIMPITRLIKVEDCLDFLTNRTVVDFSDELKSALQSLWSMAAVMGTEKTSNALVCASCGIALPSLDSKSLKEHLFMVQVHGFMDEYNLTSSGL